MHTNRLNLFIVGGLVGVTTICGVVLASTNYKTYATNSGSGSANASVTVGAACSLKATTNPPHITTIANGTSSSDDGFGLTTIKATCNDAGGFSIYAVGWTNDTYGTTTMVGSANSSNVINTGTSGSNSWWAMKLGTSGSSYVASIQNSFNNWHAVPSAWTEVARYTSTTDVGDSATGSTITTTYKASISATQAADTYIGKVRYTLTHPYGTVPPAPQSTQAGKICYYANASSAVGTMGCQTIPTSGGDADTVTPTSATLLASNFSRDGYGFAGWNDKFDYSGNFYGPQEYIEFTQGQYSGSNSGLSLYAVWVKSEGNLQDSATVVSVCSRLTQSGPSVPKTLNSVSALTDQRDNQTYAIAKLADGNCWMIENLRLEAENSTNESLAQGFGKSTTYGNFIGLADVESANFTGDSSSATAATSANSKYYAGTQEGTATIDISQTDYAGYRMPRYNNTNTSARATSPTANTDTSIYSYGNYYTWSAAMANTIYYNSATTTDADGNTSESVNTSLCPAGWRLPRGGNKPRQSTNDLWALVVTGVNSEVNPANYDSSSYPNYNGTTEAVPVAKKLRSFPNNFLYSGRFTTSSAGNRGSGGYYWSSTASSYTDSHYLGFSSSSVLPGTLTLIKYRGISIRCMAVKKSI